MERRVEAVEQISPAEERFERWRREALAALMLLPLPGLKPEAYRLAAVMAGHCATVGDSDLIG
jgi:hypothetical protein